MGFMDVEGGFLHPVGGLFNGFLKWAIIGGLASVLGISGVLLGLHLSGNLAPQQSAAPVYSPANSASAAFQNANFPARRPSPADAIVPAIIASEVDVGDGMSDVVDNVADVGGDVADSVSDVGDNIMDASIGDAPDLEAPEVLGDVGDVAENAVPDTIDAVQDVAESAGETLGEHGEAMGEVMENIGEIGDIIPEAGELPELDMEGFGEGLGDGFGEGIDLDGFGEMDGDDGLGMMLMASSLGNRNSPFAIPSLGLGAANPYSSPTGVIGDSNPYNSGAGLAATNPYNNLGIAQGPQPSVGNPTGDLLAAAALADGFDAGDFGDMGGDFGDFSMDFDFGLRKR